MRQDLKTLEQRWGLALQSAAFGIWDLDVPAGLVHYSPEWKAMLGYAAGPAARPHGDTDSSPDAPDSTATWRARVHPDDLQPMVDALTEHLEGRSESYQFEFRLRTAAGQWRWVLSRGRVVQRDAEGRALRAVGTLMDVTDRREAQALREARDRAEAANRAKTEFLSRMSHELRTPLNAILGFAQLLARQVGSGDIPAQRRQAGHIEQAGWHLLGMIEDVLDLSCIESGQMAMDLQPVPLAPLLDAVLTMMQPLAQKHGVALHGQPVPPGACVTADSGRLKQVLTNLVSNAIKYNRPQGQVELRCEAAAAGWQIAVADTGLGIPAAQMQHLFEPFNRLGRQGSGVEGVGLGLALTRWMVQAQAGDLGVHSVEGEGSTFTVRLPAAQGQAPG